MIRGFNESLSRLEDDFKCESNSLLRCFGHFMCPICSVVAVFFKIW